MSETTLHDLKRSPLGKATTYTEHYCPALLFCVPRSHQRADIGIGEVLPFKGMDVWNAFELSWLNEKGKPMVAMGRIDIPCESPNLLESKSIKLYLHSFNQTSFEDKEKVSRAISTDLSVAAGAQVKVDIRFLSEIDRIDIRDYQSLCLDPLDVSIESYDYNPDLLCVEKNKMVEETLHTHLLKSKCLVTGQPDWGSVEIHYRGPKMNHEGLLRYIISFRQHIEFHEHCVERMFMDVMRRCQPEKLTIEARYTRRGGLDINPFRTTEPHGMPTQFRLYRQ